jgi:hypothetical protein
MAQMEIDDLSRTGLVGHLEELSDLSCVESSPSTSRPNSPDFPEPMRRVTRGAAKTNRLNLRKAEADKNFPGFETVQTDVWHLNDARRCLTAFKGRANQIDATRVTADVGMSPKEHLNLLKKNGYQYVTLR